jgi:hypothetical protein
MKLTGENRSTWGGGGGTCPSAHFTTKNPPWTDPGLNPGPRVGRPATNRMSHGTATVLVLSFHLRLGFQRVLFPSFFPNMILYAFILYPMHATCPAVISLFLI